MTSLVRSFVLAALALAALVLGMPLPAHGQATGVLHVRVALDRNAMALPRLVLLVSDNPASRVPWRLIVGRDGTGRVTLPAGNYTVESEEPLVFQGKALEWRQTLDIAAATDATLTLTIDNAEVTTPAEPAATAEGGPPRFDEWDVLLRWQDSVVAIWTPTAPASGVVVGSAGLIATNQRVIGSATSVEVQLTPDTKVAAHVLASDPARDVAILWVDPATLSSRPPVRPGCDIPGGPAVERGQPVAALGTRPGGQPYPTPGTVLRLESGFVVPSFDFPIDSTGGPVFASGDVLVGLTSAAGETGEDAKVVPVGAICEVLAAAAPRMVNAAPPSATPLPVEPAARAPTDALAAAAKRRAGSLNPYQAATADFDIALITPVAAYAGLQGAMDFGNWSRYVAGAPPVLLVRVTPKQVERFWTTVARGAAMTQGIALPAFKHFKPGFARMRVTCGGVEVVPLHPFVIERRISERDAVREGLYVFDPGALGPHCGEVTMEVYSEKTPERRDAVVIDSRVIQQLAQDFNGYRAMSVSDAQPQPQD